MCLCVYACVRCAMVIALLLRRAHSIAQFVVVVCRIVVVVNRCVGLLVMAG